MMTHQQRVLLSSPLSYPSFYFLSLPFFPLLHFLSSLSFLFLCLPVPSLPSLPFPSLFSLSFPLHSPYLFFSSLLSSSNPFPFFSSLSLPSLLFPSLSSSSFSLHSPSLSFSSLLFPTPPSLLFFPSLSPYFFPFLLCLPITLLYFPFSPSLFSSLPFCYLFLVGERGLSW